MERDDTKKYLKKNVYFREENGRISIVMSNTTTDYENWSNYMKSRKGKWSIDPIKNGTYGQELLAFVPSDQDETRGVYIMVSTNGIISAGTFTDALPCITDGCFIEKFNKVESCFSVAVKFVLERLGIQFILQATSN